MSVLLLLSVSAVIFCRLYSYLICPFRSVMSSVKVSISLCIAVPNGTFFHVPSYTSKVSPSPASILMAAKLLYVPCCTAK